MNGAAGQVEGLLSEWIHLGWKNWREHFGRRGSKEPLQPDVALAVPFGRLLPCCCPAHRQVQRGRDGFSPWHRCYFPLFLEDVYLRVCTCMFARTRWLCLLAELCNMQKFAFMPTSICMAPGETQEVLYKSPVWDGVICPKANAAISLGTRDNHAGSAAPQNWWNKY